MEATGAKLAVPRYRAPDPSVFEELDAWENRWFPIARQAITDRNLLRKLGFLRRSAVGIDEELEQEAEASTQPVTAGADAA